MGDDWHWPAGWPGLPARIASNLVLYLCISVLFFMSRALYNILLNCVHRLIGWWDEDERMTAGLRYRKHKAMNAF